MNWHKSAKGVLCAALLTSAVIAIEPTAHAAGNTLTVNVGTVVRPVTHVASGGLYGVASATQPTTAQLRALRPNTFTQPAPGTTHLGNGATTPCCDALKVAGNITNAGAQQYIRMPDIYPTFPYNWVSWADWETKVRNQVNARMAATGTTNIAGWELWNEPDWTWDYADAGSFEAGWTRTHRLIRSLDNRTPIVGPSYSVYRGDWMRIWLRNARDTNTLPDITVWHELENDRYLDVAAHVADYRAAERSLGISPRPISINEYASPSQVDIPSVSVHYMSVFERHGIKDAERAYWYEPGTFDGLFHNGQPTASYWAYRWYADQSGNIVQTIPSSWLDGVASYDSSRRQVNVVFGGDSGTNSVRINGVGVLGSQVNVRLQRTNNTGRFTNQSAPVTISNATYTVNNGSITIPVSNMDAGMAYQALVTPTTGATTWQQTYEAENANVQNAVTVRSGAASNGHYVGRIDNNTDMRTHSFVDFLVEVPSARSYTLTIRYANGTGANATHGIASNGSAFSTVNYPATAGWGQFSTVTRTINLNAGFNSIRLAKGSPNFAGGVGFAELDNIRLS